MKKEFLHYVEDTIEAMDDALKFTEGMQYDHFVKDKKSIYAVTRAVEIIGEAVKNTGGSKNALSPDALERNGWNER